MNDKPKIEEYLDYIGATVPSMGSGWRKMKCPFHSDSHASAAINYDKGAFICHGCGVKGDVYSLIMYKEGVDFREAIEFAASVLTTGDTAIRSKARTSNRLSVKPSSIGRRGQHLSSGGGRRPNARA